MTLPELSAKIADTIAGKVKTLLNGKVDKVIGKGLSTNDYTTAEKNKLSGIEAQANKTVIDSTLSNTGQAADAKTTGDNLSALQNLLRRMEIHCTASGNPATFSDADAANLKALSVTVTPTQSGSGDPSPSNIRPITGAASVSVTRTGKNLFNSAWLLNAQTWSENSGTYTGNIARLMNAYNDENPFPIAIEPDTQYAVSYVVENIASVSTGARMRIDYSDGTSQEAAAPAGEPLTVRLITAAGKSVRAMYFTYGFQGLISLRDIQVECGSGTDYETYQGQSVTVTLTDGSNPLTVYGGTLDVTAGTLTVTHKSVTLNGGEDWQGPYNGTFPVYQLLIPDKLSASSSSLCDRFVNSGTDYAVWATDKAPEFSYTDHGLLPRVYMKAANDIMTSAGFQAWLAANPTQLVYALAAPVTYQLTPQQLTTLSGYNSISSNAGALDVTYKADTSLVFGGG